jgi:Flp pilus assembly protein TadB
VDCLTRLKSAVSSSNCDQRRRRQRQMFASFLLVNVDEHRAGALMEQAAAD